MSKKAQTEKQLNLSKRKNWIIRINTSNPDRDSFDGIVLKNSKDFIVVQKFYDFEFDGIIFLPKKWIVGVRNGDLEKNFNIVCRFNGTIKKVKNYKGFLKLDSIKEILLLIKNVREWPIIEGITNRKSSLYIGHLEDVGDDFLKICCYDAKGKWEGVYKLGMEKVFKIVVNSKYGNYFNRFMSSRMRSKNGK